MSVKVMGRVWDDNGIKGSMKLLLLAIADFADDSGRAWPSVETLAEKIGMGERNTRYMLRSLEEQGRIGVDIAGGPKGSSVYRVLTPEGGQSLPPAKSNIDTEGGQTLPQGGAKYDTKGGQWVAPDPSLDPPIDPSCASRAAAEPPAPPVTPPTPEQTGKKPTSTPVQSVAFALDGDPLPTSQASTPLSLSKLPAVIAYRDMFLAYPPKAQMVQMQAHGIEDMERWRSVLGAWCRCGYSPRNIGGMLDWYDDPARMTTPGTKGAKPGAARAPAQSKVAASLQAVDDVFAMLDRSGGMD